MPIEVIRQATFGNTYFRDIYSSLNGKCTESHGELFLSVKISSCLCSYFWGTVLKCIF